MEGDKIPKPHFSQEFHSDGKTKKERDRVLTPNIIFRLIFNQITFYYSMEIKTLKWSTVNTKWRSSEKFQNRHALAKNFALMERRKNSEE